MGRGLAGDLGENLPFGLFPNGFNVWGNFHLQGRMATFLGKEEDVEAGKQSKGPALVSTFCQWLAFCSELRGRSAYAAT